MIALLRRVGEWFGIGVKETPNEPDAMLEDFIKRMESLLYHYGEDAVYTCGLEIFRVKRRYADRHLYHFVEGEGMRISPRPPGHKETMVPGTIRIDMYSQRPVLIISDTPEKILSIPSDDMLEDDEMCLGLTLMDPAPKFTTQSSVELESNPVPVSEYRLVFVNVAKADLSGIAYGPIKARRHDVI